MKFLCDSCKAKYQIGDDKVAGKTVRMKCRRCGHLIQVSASVTESSVARRFPSSPPGPMGGATAKAVRAPAARPGSLGRDAPPAGVAVRRSDAPTRVASVATDDDDDEKTAVMRSPPRIGRPPTDPPPPSSGRSPTRSPLPGLAQMANRAAAGRAGAAPRPGGPPRPGAAPRLGAAPIAQPVRAPGGAAAAHARPGEAPDASADAGPPQSGVAAAFAREMNAAAPPSSSHASTPSEDWYVGVAGVPVGPIRLAAIREKAAMGAVDGDSLVWREGFDEWQPLRNFPELLEIVTEAVSGRASQVPGRRPSNVPRTPDPAAARRSSPLVAVAEAARARTTGQYPLVRPDGSLGADASAPTHPAQPSPFGAPAPAVAASSFGMQQPSPFAPPAPAPSGPGLSAPSQPIAAAAGSAPGARPIAGPVDVISDPFAKNRDAPFGAPKPAGAEPPHANGIAGISGSPFAPTIAAAPEIAKPGPPSISEVAFEPRRRRQGMHPLAWAFIAMAGAFGAVAAWFLLVTRPQPQPQIVVVQGPSTAAPTATATAAPDPAGTVDVGDPVAQTPQKGGSGAPRGAPQPAQPAPQGAPIDTSGFSAPGGPVAGPNPGSGPGNAGGQLSAGEIQGVVTQNQANIRRKCWEPALAGKTKDGPANARINATVKIAPSGAVDSVNASGAEGDFPGLSSCIASRIKGWKFPASGGPTTVSVPFVFAAQ